MRVLLFFGLLLTFLSGEDKTAEILKKMQESLLTNDRQDLQNTIGASYNPFEPSVLNPLQQDKEEIRQEANQTIPQPSDEPQRLQAIYQGKRAMIDGKWYKRGDEIGRYKLKAIYDKKVILVEGGEKLELKLFKDFDMKVTN